VTGGVGLLLCLNERISVQEKQQEQQQQQTRRFGSGFYHQFESSYTRTAMEGRPAVDDDGSIGSSTSFEIPSTTSESKEKKLIQQKSSSSLLLPTTTTKEEEGEDNLPQHAGATMETVVMYDFVIVGHGNAGQSALETLQSKCPTAKIAVIDPLRGIPTKVRGRQFTTNKKVQDQDQVQHYRDTVCGFNPSTKTVSLLAQNDTQIRYRHGILIATGARGAPPPLELFEQSALARVLELRPTELPNNTKRPMMAPETVRRTVAEAAAKGAKIAVLGSGWEALDLVVLVAEQVGNKNKKNKPPTICFASQGPVWHILPNYLSTELRRKLQRRGVDVQDRSYVRYVADIQHLQSRKIELHTAKTYDLLDTRRIVLDLLIVAPDSFGAKGTAALPTTDVPERMKESNDGRPWYKTWSQISTTSNLEPSTVVCFEDDGRIAVNTELAVASRIYAAGGCAKYPNSSTGHSCTAGEGGINGEEAGRIAALNMSRDFAAGRSFGFGTSRKPNSLDDDVHSFAAYSLPVWRSDITSYPTPGSEDRISALSSIGVQALCVGNCDSERQATRGFWWTNSSAQRKMTRLILEEEEEEAAAAAGSSTNGERSSTRLARRNTRRQMKQLGLVQPIYGIGVVFYLDNYGRIQGIMTWGLPFAEREGGKMNTELLGYLKYLIASNAGVSALDAEENHQIVNLALGKASQKVVSLAVRGHSSHTTRVSHNLDGPVEGFSMPLYRYTEVGILKNNTVNVLKRKGGDGLGVLGENLYARDEFVFEEELGSDSPPEQEVTPSNIPTTMYPITVVPFQVEEAYGRKAASLESLAELNRYLAVQRGWEANENRARPGKEDPIWLRPGDERKNTSRKQMIIDAYRQIMFPHRS
jgi:hypothetical protein